ncbi:MAG: SemiSWEET family sugar transporter [Sodaliphilus sp.]
MNHELLTNIVGYIASISMVLGYLPQTVRTLRTRKTDDIALGTFLLMGLGGLFFCIQGLLLANWPLFLCNLCTTTMSAIIFAIKMHNDYFKKK